MRNTCHARGHLWTYSTDRWGFMWWRPGPHWYCLHCGAAKSATRRVAYDERGGSGMP